MPPTNTSATTAIRITSLPYDVVQTGIHDAGTTYSVWYYYVAQPGDVVIGVWGFGDLTTYSPDLEIYRGPATAPVIEPLNANPNRPVQWPVTPGVEYFLKFIPNSGNPNPATLTLSVLPGPNIEAPPGSIIVPDDTAGHPAVVLSRVDGSVLGFISPFPPGESGDMLPTGEFLVDDNDTSSLALYDANAVQLATIAMTNDHRIRRHVPSNTWYAGERNNPIQVRTITPTGELSDPINLTGMTTLHGIAASDDETVLYFTAEANGAAIRRWDLVNNVLLSNFADGITDYRVPDIMPMDDGSIVALYDYYNTPTNVFIRIYNPDGTVRRQIELGTANHPFGTPQRLAYATDRRSFWVWTHDLTPDGISRFREFRASDGATLTELTVREFEGGAYNGVETATPERFGISFSCPFMVAHAGVRIPPELCCECPCPPPRDPAREPIETATGPVIPPEDPSTMEFQCVGGGDVDTAADLTDDESWVS